MLFISMVDLISLSVHFPFQMQTHSGQNGNINITVTNNLNVYLPTDQNFLLQKVWLRSQFLSYLSSGASLLDYSYRVKKGNISIGDKVIYLFYEEVCFIYRSMSITVKREYL